MACGANGSCGCSGSSLTGYGGCNDSCPSVQIFDWLPASSKIPGRDHCDLVEVVFKGRRRKVYHNKQKIPVRAGDDIIVSAQRGLDYGQVALAGELVHIRARQNQTMARSSAWLHQMIGAFTKRTGKLKRKPCTLRKQLLGDGNFPSNLWTQNGSLIENGYPSSIPLKPGLRCDRSLANFVGALRHVSNSFA